MAVTKYEICSRALNKIGFEGINSFLDDTKRAGICADIWPTYSKYLLSIYDWYFCRYKTQLARELVDPVNEYRYAFLLPGNLLTLHAVYESSSVYARPIVDWDLFQDKVYANSNQIWIDYKRYTETETWPYWYVQFVINALALELAEHIPTDLGKMDRLQQRVWGLPSDNMNGGMFGFVKNMDSKMRPPELLPDPELLLVRNF